MKWILLLLLTVICQADEAVRFKYIAPSSETIEVKVNKNGSLDHDLDQEITKKELADHFAHRKNISKENRPYLSDYSILCYRLEGIAEILAMFHKAEVGYELLIQGDGKVNDRALIRSSPLREPDKIELKGGQCYLNGEKMDVTNAKLERFEYQIFCQQDSNNIPNLIRIAQGLNAIHISGKAKYSYQVVFTK